MRAPLAEVICDTDFLVRLGSGRIHNIDSACTEIGSISFAVPRSAVSELEGMLRGPKRAAAEAALARASSMRLLEEISAVPADDAIVKYVERRGGTVATLDRRLRGRVKRAGGSIVTLWQDKMVLS